jgi:hypothetical protein
MFARPSDGTDLDGLIRRIDDASAPDAHLFVEIIANGCPRAVVLVEMRKAQRLKQLIESGAWTDAALELLELDLPQWKMRRVLCNDGEWYCRLSAQPWLPEGFDDVIETYHKALPLSILAAIVQVRAQTVTAPRADELTADMAPTPDYIRISCDNFS